LNEPWKLGIKRVSVKLTIRGLILLEDYFNATTQWRNAAKFIPTEQSIATQGAKIFCLSFGDPKKPGTYSYRNSPDNTDLQLGVVLRSVEASN